MSEKVYSLFLDDETKEGDCCPECNHSWDDGDVFSELKELREVNDLYKSLSDEELQEIANAYGWTEDNPVRFSKLIRLELSLGHLEHYDGPSYNVCPNCGIGWSIFDGSRSEEFISIIEERNEMFKDIGETYKKYI
jgi:hypothetical protein